MDIGRAIKKLRKQQALNQSELANNVGITQTSLSQIESGAKKPNSGTLKKICNYFQVPELVVYLLATDSSDIPERNREMFEKVFPSVSGLLLDIFNVPKELR
jgi:transcriptional regulator with XRE-family HTH domain